MAWTGWFGGDAGAPESIAYIKSFSFTG